MRAFTAIDRAMNTYGMMVNLTSEQERLARDDVAKFLEGKRFDERTLAVEGLKYLKGRPSGRREPI